MNFLHMMIAAAFPQPVTRIPIALIGDHRLVGEGIAALLNQVDYLDVVYGDISEAITPTMNAVNPEIVLLDIGPRRSDSLNVASRIRNEFPDVKVIAMDQSPIREDVVAFVNAGVSGFIMKDVSVEELVNTIRLVEHGANVLPQEMVNTLFARIARETLVRSPVTTTGSVRMTHREQEVISLIAEGLSNKQIAARLNIATHTAKSHVRNVMEKLALHSRLEVAAFAFAHSAP